jgi:SpoVK/Ycf46/Vps4 family AAA+-type ATPase
MHSNIITVETQQQFINKMVDAMRYFFGRGENTYSDHFSSQDENPNFPFKGFILAGPPGSGKTEAVLEVGRSLAYELSQTGVEVRLFHVNSANINRANLGENEERLRRVFRDAKGGVHGRTTRTIILFDDIETLLVKRTDAHTSEWSRAMNGVFFHELDQLVTTQTMVVATTNEPELIDDAVTSRLSLKEAPAPTVDEMIQISTTALPIQGANGKTREDLQKECTQLINLRLREGEPPSFRLARKSAIEILMSQVVGWDS